MKKLSNKTGEGIVSFFIIILLIIALPFILIYVLITTIADYFKYKSSQYYKDTKEKYSWICANSQDIKFYNEIKENALPIEFYRNKDLKYTGRGYFVYKDILFLSEYDADVFYFDEEKEEWLVYDEHDYLLLENEADEEIKNANKFFMEERCKRAAVFVEKELLKNTPEKQYERLQLLPIENDDRVSAVQEILK